MTEKRQPELASVTAGLWSYWQEGLQQPRIFAKSGKHIAIIGNAEPYPADEEWDANAHFILAAVNACFSISPEHPECVPPLIEPMARAIQDIDDLVEAGFARGDLAYCLGQIRSITASLLARLTPGDIQANAEDAVDLIESLRSKEDEITERDARIAGLLIEIGGLKTEMMDLLASLTPTNESKP